MSVTGHEAEAAHATQQAERDDRKKRPESEEQEDGFLMKRIKKLPWQLWLIMFAVILRISSHWTGVSDYKITAPGVFEPYSVSSMFILLVLYADIGYKDLERVSQPGVDQHSEGMIVQRLGYLQYLLAVIATVVLFMGEQNWFTLAFANIESFAFAWLTTRCGDRMLRVDRNIAQRSMAAVDI